MMNQKKLLLLILVGILLLAIGYAYWAAPRRERLPDTEKEGSPAPAGEAESVKPARKEGLRLELLETSRKPYPGYDRNIFRFRQKVSPKPSPAPPPPPPEPEPEPEISPFPVPQPVQRNLARFTFLGFLEKQGRRTIFLSKDREEIFLVREGDRFGDENQFLASDLTENQLIIRQDDFPGAIAVPLVEQAPLSPTGPTSEFGPEPRRPETGEGEGRGPDGVLPTERLPSSEVPNG